jgi:hypothetical protein
MRQNATSIFLFILSQKYAVRTRFEYLFTQKIMIIP